MSFEEKTSLIFVELIKRLKEANEKGEFFSQKMEHVRINITDNRLSELSQYALTPTELIFFYKSILIN